MEQISGLGSTLYIGTSVVDGKLQNPISVTLSDVQLEDMEQEKKGWNNVFSCGFEMHDEDYDTEENERIINDCEHYRLIIEDALLSHLKARYRKSKARFVMRALKVLEHKAKNLRVPLYVINASLVVKETMVITTFCLKGEVWYDYVHPIMTDDGAMVLPRQVHLFMKKGKKQTEFELN